MLLILKNLLIDTITTNKTLLKIDILLFKKIFNHVEPRGWLATRTFL